MKKLINKLKNEWDFVKMMARFEGRERTPYWFRVLRGVLFVLKHKLLKTYCIQFGHDWVDADSYATPETAVDYLECHRCGETHSHTHY